MKIVRLSQKIDAAEWPEDLLVRDQDIYYWSDRSCGIACLKMILSYYGLHAPSLYKLLLDGLRLEAYSNAGWIHKGLADISRCYGLFGIALPINDIDHIQILLKEFGPLIASVTLGFPITGKKGGHLVIITSIECRNNLQFVKFVDPSSWGEFNNEIDFHRFSASFSKRVICFSRSELIFENIQSKIFNNK